MSDPINKMFPSGGGMRGEPALVCVTYDSNGDPCGISGLPDFAENYVEALAAERDRLAALSRWQEEQLEIQVYELARRASRCNELGDRIQALGAERDRLVAQLAEARAEGWRLGIEAAAEDLWAKHVAYMTSKGRNPGDYSSSFSLAHDAIRDLPMPADLGGRDE